MFDNLKIAITDEVHLKAVCDVLETMGYTFNCGCDDADAKMITANNHYMQYDIYNHVSDWECNSSLTDLLAMRDKQFMEKINLAELKEM